MRQTIGFGRLLVILLAVAGCLFAGPASERTVMVTVTGESARSFAEAKEDAFRRAVEAGAGTEVFSDTRVADFALMHDTIVTRAAGYLAAFDVVSQEQRDGVYAVTIRATVAIGRIRDAWGALQILLQRKGRPNLLIVVAEEARGLGDTGNTAEFTLRDRFRERGFDLVDDTALAKVADRDTVHAMVAGDLARAAAVGQQLHAGYVIAGKAIVEKGEPQTPYAGATLTPVTATVSLKAVATDNAALLTSKSEQETVRTGQEPAQAARQALVAAVRRLEPQLLAAILEAWSRDLDQGAKIEVVGTRLPTDLVNALVDSLRATAGIGTASIVDHNPELTTLTVVTRLEPKDLGALMARLAGGRLVVTGVSPGRVTLAVGGTVPSPGPAGSANGSTGARGTGRPGLLWAVLALGLAGLLGTAFWLGRRNR